MLKSETPFVLLEHTIPPQSGRVNHWDLMVEHQGSLMTWELPIRSIQSWPLTPSLIICRRLPDHRLHYLDYEGEISENRGFVSRICKGMARWMCVPIASESNSLEAINNQEAISCLEAFQFQLESPFLSAQFSMQRATSWDEPGMWAYEMSIEYWKFLET